jgi:hypothetical protein
MSQEEDIPIAQVTGRQCSSCLPLAFCPLLAMS